MELSIEEVLALAQAIGFELLEHESVESVYTGVKGGLFKFVYEAQMWVMRKPGRGVLVDVDDL
jgi:hypothetical protein